MPMTPSQTILTNLRQKEFADFTSLFDPTEGKLGVVVTFLAVLELLRESLVELVQSEPFAPIHIKSVAVDGLEEVEALGRGCGVEVARRGVGALRFEVRARVARDRGLSHRA